MNRKAILLTTGGVILVIAIGMVVRLFVNPASKLRMATRKTSEIRVYFGKQLVDEKVLLVIKDKKEIHELRDRLELIFPGTPKCQCFGGGSLVFYSGEKELCFLEITCQGNLRWSEGWPKDYGMSTSFRKHLQSMGILDAIKKEMVPVK